MSARWFDNLINNDMNLKTSPITKGWQQDLRLAQWSMRWRDRQTSERLLLPGSTFTKVVFTDQILNFVHLQYTFVNWYLRWRQRAKNNLVSFLGELQRLLERIAQGKNKTCLILDNFFCSVCKFKDHRMRNNWDWDTFWEKIEGVVYLSRSQPQPRPQ
jgi:hypothetical protein